MKKSYIKNQQEINISKITSDSKYKRYIPRVDEKFKTKQPDVPDKSKEAIRLSHR